MGGDGVCVCVCVCVGLFLLLTLHAPQQFSFGSKKNRLKLSKEAIQTNPLKKGWQFEVSKSLCLW